MWKFLIFFNNLGAFGRIIPYFASFGAVILFYLEFKVSKNVSVLLQSRGHALPQEISKPWLLPITVHGGKGIGGDDRRTAKTEAALM